MSGTGVANAFRLLAEALDVLDEATGPTATDDELIALPVSEGVTRRLDRLVVKVVDDLQRRGSFVERGYPNPVTALADLLGWDRADARRRLVAVEQAHPRTRLDGTPLPAHLSCTAQVFVPLDVGRLTRVVPDGLRRAVVARDRGCARCGRPPSWCEAHHIVAWEHGGATALKNLVLLCRACHRLIHHTGWDVKLIGGLPEFYPPTWIDPQRRPRRRPPPVPDAA